MKRKTVEILFAVMMVTAFLSSCGGHEVPKSDTSEPEVEIETGKELIQADDPKAETEEVAEKMLQMKINGTAVNVSWEENESVEALMDLCKDSPLEIQMSMYGGFEQVGPLGTNLQRNDLQTTTSPGDIVLYSGNKIVIFYGSNSWSYTRLGHITDQDNEGIKELLGQGDVTITISVE